MKRIYLDLIDEKDSVTGTCQLLNAYFPGTVLATAGGYTNNIPFIVDCGAFQGIDSENHSNTTFNFDISNVEFGILTHGHLDHYGRYPIAIKQGFHAPIFTTYVTKSFLSQVFLDDCLKIEKRHAKKLDVEPNYDENEITKMKNFMIPCAYHKRIQYNDNICIYFFDNGHVPGAAVTLIQLTYPGHEDINIVVTGDYNDHNTFYKVNPLPDWVYNLPNLTIIIEATYGGTLESELRPACFVKNVIKALSEKKTAVVASFSFVRTQEVLYALKEAQDTGKLDSKYPIYLDGKTAIGCTEMFANGAFKMYPYTRDFLPENLTIVEDKEYRRFLKNDPTPKIIVSSSGSGSHGPSQYYIDAYYHNPDSIIHATGHIFPESKLGKLRNDETALAQFFDTDEFSAHPKQEGLIKFLRPFKSENIKSIAIHHGEPASKEALAKVFLEEFNTKVHILSSDTTFRITSDGIIACFPRNLKINNQIR